MTQEELQFKYSNDIYSCLKTAYIKGFAKGLAESVPEGQENRSIEVAKKLMKHNIPIDYVARYSGLSEDEINDL